MFKVSITINEKLFDKYTNIRKESAEAIAGIVAEEFEQLLFNAPQYTGSFVANMAVQGGLSGPRGATKHTPDATFDRKISPEQAAARGQLPAIMHAKKKNPNIVKNLTGHITKSAGWLTGVTIYNNWTDAEVVEALAGSQLRPGNAEGAHAMQQAEARLQQRANQPVLYDSAEFHRLRNVK